jgi:hypothetical protein
MMKPHHSTFILQFIVSRRSLSDCYENPPRRAAGRQPSVLSALHGIARLAAIHSEFDDRMPLFRVRSFGDVAEYPAVHTKGSRPTARRNPEQGQPSVSSALHGIARLADFEGRKVWLRDNGARIAP